MKPTNTPHPHYEQPDAGAEFVDESENLLVFSWAVPGVAKVPVPRQHPALQAMVLQPAAISSTVPTAIDTELRANNTALRAGWCYTATLAAPSGRA